MQSADQLGDVLGEVSGATARRRPAALCGCWLRGQRRDGRGWRRCHERVLNCAPAPHAGRLRAPRCARRRRRGVAAGRRDAAAAWRSAAGAARGRRGTPRPGWAGGGCRGGSGGAGGGAAGRGNEIGAGAAAGAAGGALPEGGPERRAAGKLKRNHCRRIGTEARCRHLHPPAASCHRRRPTPAAIPRGGARADGAAARPLGRGPRGPRAL